MDDIDTPEKLSDLLKSSGISDGAIEVLKEEEISGEEFLDLSQEDLKGMNLKMGQIKKLLKLQAQYKPQAEQVSVNPTKSIQCTQTKQPNPPREPTLSEKAKEWCIKKSTKGRMDFYEMPLQEITKNESNAITTVQVGPKSAHLVTSPGRVLMVVGATGAGKSTLINAMVNYIFGVQWEDDFRFKMIVEAASADQSKSVTKWITAYIIPAQQGSCIPYDVTIIDTPGFGDTQGIQRDKEIIKQIKALFATKGPGGIDQLHGIGFVAQASLARLTHTQKYIFDSILAIFGKDVAKNVFMMITFADGQVPPVLEAVQASKISYDAHFKFNNSALYCDNKQSQFDKLFWEMGIASQSNFFTSLQRMSAISLSLTRKVLDEREQLEAIMTGLQDQIQRGLEKIERLRKTKEDVKDRKADIERNKNFQIKTEIDATDKLPLQAGQYTTNCTKCNYTCHYPCIIPNTSDKQYCGAMRGQSHCAVCPGKCHWTCHVNDSYRVVWTKKPHVETKEDLKRKYYDAKSGLTVTESIVQGLERELDKEGERVYSNIQKAQGCVQSLEKIALKPNPLSEVEYIELLIKSEEQQKNPGYIDRVSTLKKVKDQAELLAKVKAGKISKAGKSEQSWSFFRS